MQVYLRADRVESTKLHKKYIQVSKKLDSLDKDLHASAQTQHQVEGGLLLDVVVCQGATILQLLASKDQTLLVWGDAFLVLDLALHILDGVG